MATTAVEAAKPGRRRDRGTLLLEVVGLLGLIAALLAAVPLRNVVGAGVLPHVWMLLRMLVVLGAATWLLRRSGESWADMGLERPKSWWRVAGLVVAGYVMLGIVMRLILPPILHSLGARGADLGALAGLQGNLAEYLFLALPVSLGTAAVIEELVARGFLLNRLAQLLARDDRPAWVLAALVQAVLFALAHAYQGLGGMIGVAMIGLVLGSMYLLGKRNLWACIILHGLADFVSITAIYAGLPVGR
jgi:membrane protease YdiL (CAAX protease family)